jgi:hypothetical protein
MSPIHATPTPPGRSGVRKSRVRSLRKWSHATRERGTGGNSRSMVWPETYEPILIISTATSDGRTPGKLGGPGQGQRPLAGQGLPGLDGDAFQRQPVQVRGDPAWIPVRRTRSMLPFLAQEESLVAQAAFHLQDAQPVGKIGKLQFGGPGPPAPRGDAWPCRRRARRIPAPTRRAIPGMTGSDRAPASGKPIRRAVRRAGPGSLRMALPAQVVHQPQLPAQRGQPRLGVVVAQVQPVLRPEVKSR